MLDDPTTSGPDRAWMLAALWAAGCVLTSSAALLPLWPDSHRSTLIAIAAAAGVGAVVQWLARRRSGELVAHAGVALGLVLIGGCIVGAGREGGPAFGFALVWVGCYSAMFFSRRAIVAHIALAAAVQAVALVHLGFGVTAAAQVVMQVGVSSVAAATVGSLVARMRTLVVCDPLTGLLNRRGLAGALERELEAVRRGGGLTVLAIDLDHFKQLNDRNGHAAGDALLAQLAAAWRAHLRPSDTAARIGGDEFAILLPGDSTAAASAVAARLVTALDTVDPGRRSGVGITFGAAAALADDTPASLLGRADASLYEAKAARLRRVDDRASARTWGRTALRAT